MAIIKLGPLIVGIRGTAGGMTFAANKSGPYVKPWQRRTIVSTERQAAARIPLMRAAGRWRQITQAQRNDWDTWADMTAPARFNSLGEPLVLSGFNWYCELNSHRFARGFNANDPAPLGAEPPPANIATWTVDSAGGGSAIVTWTGTIFATFRRAARVAMAIGTGSNSFARPVYATFLADFTAGTSWDISADVLGYFGGISLGRRWYIQLIRENSEGLRGPFAQDVTDTI